MNAKASLYAVIGGVVGAVLTMAVCSVMPIGAQNGDATFGEITCTGLKVVDFEGTTKVLIHNMKEYGGQVSVFGKAGSVWLVTEKRGGRVAAFGKAGKVLLYTDEHGGSVSVYGKGSNESRAVMGVNEYGNGMVSTWDKNGYRLK